MTASQRVTLTLNAYNYAFVTSNAAFGANLGGLTGADSECAMAATNVGLPGHYVALISTSTTNASSRLGSAQGWIRTDGLPVANDAASLFNSGKMYYPIDVDEFGVKFVPNFILSATNDNGTEEPIQSGVSATCDDWTSNASTLEVIYGSATAAGLGWLSTGGTFCTLQGSLLCFGTDLTAPLAPAATSGRFAFLSTGTWDTATGMAAADTLCQTEATAAALPSPSSFVSLLASTTASPASRLNTSGANWVRTDGIPVASSTGAFVSGTWSAPIIVAANGTSYAATIDPGDTVATGVSASVIGSLTGAGTAATTCSGWTVDSSSGTLEEGRTGETAGFQVTFTANAACGSYHVYCLQP